MSLHKSVLLRESIDLLQVKIGKKYIDATFGAGGHAQRILELGGEVLGIDTDQNVVDYTQTKFKSQSGFAQAKIKIVQGNFKDIDKIARENIFENVFGIIYDLGVSSDQIDDPGRGFSFTKEGPLDMRMDVSSQVTASDLINLLGKNELSKVFTKFGEERRAEAIAKAIVKKRKIKAIKKTSELVEVIESVYDLKGKVSEKLRANLSKRVFQALRIAVNSEIENLGESLPKSLKLLEKEGRLVVISFHSLEDRVVKNTFRIFEQEKKVKILTKKPIVPSYEEIKINNRARSAKLRAIEKL